MQGYCAHPSIGIALRFRNGRDHSHDQRGHHRRQGGVVDTHYRAVA
jgi:hypothetical protein